VTGKLIASSFVVGLVLQGGTAIAKQARTYIDLSVTADGTCLAKIVNETIPITQHDLEARLPALLPKRNANIGLRGEDTPYRCVAVVLSSLRRLKYETIGFDFPPPPLNPDIKIPDPAPQ